MEKETQLESINKLLSLLQPFLEEKSLEVWSTNVSIYGRFVLQLMLFQNNSEVSLEDCRLVSRKLSDLISTEAPELEDYELEISSTGIFAPLKSHFHWIKSKGKRIKLTLSDQRKHIGKLLESKEDGVIILDEQETRECFFEK